jgi:uncharacterized protein (DUF2147 family)
MKNIVLCGIAYLTAAAVPAFGAAIPAPGAAPLGEWVVEDGVARVRIVDCDSRLWGVVSWEKKPGGIDAQNPDTTKRGRATLGIPILLNLKKSPAEGGTDLWVGKVYNAENGKIYDAKIKPLGTDKLELKGCVLGFLCGGQTWTRYVDPTAPAPTSTGTTPPPPGMVKGKSAPAKGAAAVDPAGEICSLPEIAGAPH